MTKIELLELVHFDKAHVSLNPYFFGNEYEEKGVLILLKIEEGSNLDYLDIENICFQCPNMEAHPDLISMVLLLFDKDNVIYDYSIAASKYKVTRSTVLMYEKLIGEVIE